MKNTLLNRLRLVHLFLFLATLALVCSVFLNGCVSLKKYRLLEKDYQNCGEDQRSYEQLKRILECEKANDTIQKVNRK